MKDWNIMDDTPTFNFDSDKLLLKLSVTLSAERSAIPPVVEGVMNIVRDLKCATGKEDDIELALTEALANAVVHGAKGDSSKTIECDVACDENQSMLIIVRDPGTWSSAWGSIRCTSVRGCPSAGMQQK